MKQSAPFRRPCVRQAVSAKYAFARAACACVAAVFAITAVAAPPGKVTVHYDVSYNGIVVAEGSETLEHDGRSYRIQSETRGKGVFAMLYRGTIKRSSRGAIVPSGLRPVEFIDQRGERAPESARFDWAARTVVLSRNNGERQTIKAMDDMQDRLSFLWGLAFDVPKGLELSATIVDGRGTTRYKYDIAGKEVLKTAVGSLETLRLVKQRDAGDNRGTEVWLATTRNFLPVRLLVTERDGTRMDSIVTRIAP